VVDVLQTQPGQRLDAAAAAIQAVLKQVDVAEALHMQDEDESLFPRLAGIEAPAHEELNAMWARLRPVLVALLVELDAGRAPDPTALARLLPPYVAAQRAHHAQEEATIWPVAAALGAEELATIAAEMKARRARGF
jgi:hypothetical protein